MSNLEIQIEDNKTTFLPGEEIRGIAKWELDNEPASLDVSLFWRTEGRSTQDIGVAETAGFENPGASGQKDFKFTSPNGPYSFSGKLISIVWALELATVKGKDVLRKEITISPTGQKITNTESIPDSDENIAKGVLGNWAGQFKRDGQS
jgi:hypothetical protein